MIPMTFLSKIGIYNIPINGVTLKVKVVDKAQLVTDFINGSLLPQASKVNRLVGIDLKTRTVASLLILCNKSDCLIVQLRHLDSVPTILTEYLRNPSVCFVGVDIVSRYHYIRYLWNTNNSNTYVSPYHLKGEKDNAIDLGLLAAKVLKKPELCNAKDFNPVAAAAGVASPGLPPRNGSNSNVIADYDAKVFSEDEVKKLVVDAYYSYYFGDKIINVV